MDFKPRGRSPSHPRSNHISPQPSPHRFPNATTDIGLDPAISNATFTTGRFTKGSSSPGPEFAYPDPGQLHTSSAEENALLNQNNFHNAQNIGFQGSQEANYNFLANEPSFFGEDSNMSGGYTNTDFEIDPTFDINQQSNINPADLSKMSSPPSSTPPNLLSPENHNSPGQAPSPGSTPGQYFTPQHSRHQSLDPSSAAYPMGSAPAEWQGSSFQHQRAPSDHSDISSNAPSPYLGHAEPVDVLDNSHSPLMPPQSDGLGGLIENFSINDHTQPHMSPGHSPFMSPQLDSQQTMTMTPDMMLQHNMQIGLSAPGPEIYTTQPDNAYGDIPGMHHRSISLAPEIGQANQYPPPSINIEPPAASISRQGSFGEDMGVLGSLSPPASKGQRGRSKSDPHVNRNAKSISRSVSPGPGRSHSPSLSAISNHSSRSLSPGLGPISRDSSPGASSGRVEKNRRQSASSIPREVMIALADPDRPNPAQSPGRGQKHPATFQCSLCPKRFTRAYNLRSHLRTHTDERPFVCTVCGKAFARQHDRKRHEGLHSGEKKFVCRGDLGSGNHWGCGRKFARADALGRHFRSEAGRICIKPLLDEEAAERARNRLLEHQQHQQHHLQQSQHQQQQHQHQHQQMQYPGLRPVPQPMLVGGGLDASGAGSFPLPAALLAQYPALSNIDWAALPQGEDPGDLSDVGVGGMGRSSFDASEGGYDFDGQGGGGISGGEMSDAGQGGPYGVGVGVGVGIPGQDSRLQFAPQGGQGQW